MPPIAEATAATRVHGRSTPPSRWIAWGIWGLCLGFACATIALDFAFTRTMGGDFPLYEPIFVLSFLTFPTVGALIVSRRPGHLVGWLFCVVGLCWSGLVLFAGSYASYALIARENTLPFGILAGWITLWNFLPAVGLTIVVLPLFFPNGHLAGPRWRWVLYICGLGLLIGFVGLGFLPDSLVQDSERMGYTFDSGYANPVGIATLEPLLAFMGKLGPLLVVGCGLASAASLILRFRRSHGTERLQLKWCVFAFAIAASGFLVEAFWRLTIADRFSVATLVSTICFCAIPVAAGIAILRYRLYDIDRIVNRTLVYGVLSASLGLGYAGLVLLQQVFNPLEHGSDLWVAVSTLTVAALFRPMRSRIQLVVDRRFYRNKYDATRTIDDFSERLRHELDLDTLLTELLDVIGDTMQPRSASIWLRD